MSGIAAIAVCAAFTSCSKNSELFDQNAAEQQKQEAINKNIETAKANYAAAFEKAFGKVGSNVDWGFGSGKASTRASELLKEKFTLPKFRETNPIVKPELPTTFTFQNTVPSTAKYAKDYQNYQKGDVIYINSEYQTLNQPQNTDNLTIYVDGKVAYNGQTSSNGNGTAFCVTENSTLTLGAVSNNLIVYLAPGATLNITKPLNQDGTPAIDYVWNSETQTNDLVPKSSYSFQNSHAAIYMSNGSKVKASDLNLVGGAKLLNDGGTIEAENLTLDQQATLWNEGSIKVTNTLTLTNTSSALYNKEGKKIETKNLDLINNDALLFNEGIVEATGDIALHNTNAEIINYGTLSGASYSQAAGGKIHNEDECIVNITGKTDLTNSNSKWQNDGHWTSGSFVVSGTDKNGNNNFNNCRLTVNEEFYLDRGAFILDSGAGVECGSFKIDDTSGFYLGNNSVLKIDGTLTTEIINPEYGFFAYGSEYAAVQANSIVTTTNDPQSINYYGKLLVAIKPHISQYTAESTVKFTKDNQNIATIPETDCNPGYEGEDTPTYRVIAEDLNASEASDFDFNDVVFDVEPNEAGTAAKIVVRAAGGIYKLTVAGQEVHAAFGEKAKADGLYPMINTQPWNPDVKATLIESYSGDFSSDAAIRNTIKNIEIKVYKPGFEENGIELSAQTGKPACKILVDQTFNVVTERTGIADENTNFHKYVQGTWDTETNGFWWKKD